LSDRLFRNGVYDIIANNGGFADVVRGIRHYPGFSAQREQLISSNHVWISLDGFSRGYSAAIATLTITSFSYIDVAFDANFAFLSHFSELSSGDYYFNVEVRYRGEEIGFRHRLGAGQVPFVLNISPFDQSRLADAEIELNMKVDRTDLGNGPGVFLEPKQVLKAKLFDTGWSATPGNLLW
jgi:hypothetical protein